MINTSGRHVHRTFERQVEKMPAAQALVYGSRQLTYQELNAQANRLAHYLQKLGIGPETAVGVCMERSLEAVIGQLAILKTGGAYISLDPASPQERLAFMLEDTQAPVLLTGRGSIDPAFAYHGSVICLDTDHDLFSQESDENLTGDVSDQNLAYVIYTSGSTGRPKGVQVTHGGLANLIGWHQQAFHITPMDRATQIAGLGFDASVWELWPYITIGACVYFPDEETRVAPPQLQEWLIAHAITISFLPTPLAEHILRLSWPTTTELRLLLTGGDKLHHYPSPSLPFQVVNNYGPTENTVVATSCLLAAEDQETRAPSIGRTISNVDVYVLDAEMQLVPEGEAGELYIGGTGLARGYLRRPDITAERFVPDPVSQEAGARLYRSGDLVRYRSDGNLEFLGRIDSQVKIRGLRIELGEIETLLSNHSAVRDAVVLAREDREGEKQLVAYLVPWQQDTPSSHELRTFLREHLPRYMVPAVFMWIEALPLTINGKVDQQKLPVPDRGKLLAQRNVQAARTPIEAMVVAIWSEVMHIEQVGIYDNFFDLGGHSLHATQIIARIRHTLQRELSLRDFFQAPTPADVANLIERSDEREQRLPAIQCTLRRGDLPLSSGQEQLWFLDQLAPGSAFYNIPVAVRLNGRLHTGALARSLDDIIRRHEIFKVSFIVVDGAPVQHIDANMRIALQQIDFRAMPNAEVQGFMTGEAQRPFDLSTGPLARMFLLQLRDEEYILLLIMQHSIVDGWSVGVLFRELAQLYTAYTTDTPVSLPALPIQYTDVACWQRQCLQGEVLERQLDYWRLQLQTCPDILPLPLDRPRGAVQSFRGATLSLTLSLQLAEALKDVSRQEGATLFMVLLASFNVLLLQFTGQQDIPLGTPVANRMQIETEQLIGFFVNTVVLRTDLAGDPTFLTLLRRVKEVALGAYAHQDVPFERVVEAIRPERDVSYNPLFQVSFALQDGPALSLELAGVVSQLLSIETGTTLFDISVEVTETGGGLVVSAGYSTDLFDETTILRLLHHYETLLHSIVADPEQRLAELPSPPDHPAERVGRSDQQIKVRRFRVQPEESFEAPRTPVEELLTEIWAEVLKVDQVGIRDNFFDLGGHSLLATRVVSRIRDTFQITLPVRTVFQAANVAELADVLISHEISPGHVATIARLHRQVNAMSFDEIRMTLQQRKKGA